MPNQQLLQWSHSLARAAEPALANTPFLKPTSAAALRDCIAHFKDAMGQIREVDRFLLAHLAGIDLPQLPPSPSPELLAWASLNAPALWDPPTPVGPFAPHLRETSIEVWTECELASLHARSWAESPVSPIAPRTLSAAKWLVDEIQPDNATGRPWGIHVFAFMGTTDINARMYAETLLHNTLVAGAGRAEPLSACILLDASRWLAARANATP